jgi:hypothetical protein
MKFHALGFLTYRSPLEDNSKYSDIGFGAEQGYVD